MTEKKKIHKMSYKKPDIKEKKIELNLFNSNRFLDSVNTILVPPVFAQSACITCSACASCGPTGCYACAACEACSSTACTCTW